MNAAEFLAWEQSTRDTIDVKKIYIDISGDLVTGVLLSQIVYWNLPNKDGETKLRVISDDRLWIAKGREDWWKECRISPKQFDRSISILEEKNIVVTKLKKFNGAPIKHIYLNLDNLVNLITVKLTGGEMDFPQRSKSISPKGQNLISPNGKMDFDQTVKSLTKNTTKITNKEYNNKKSVVVSPDAKLLSNSFFKKYNCEFDTARAQNLINEKGIDLCKKYLAEFDDYILDQQIDNLQAFYYASVMEEYKKPSKQKKTPQYANFEQREYEGDDFYEQFYIKKNG
jgi:hypothetical protein